MDNVRKLSLGRQITADPFPAFRGYPGRNLSPQKLGTILRELDAGYARNAMELFDEIEEKDVHLATVMQTRISAAASVERVVVPADDGEQAKKDADFVRRVWEGLSGRTRLMHDLLTAIGRGFAVAEVIYELRGGHLLPADIKFRPQALFSFADLEHPGRLLDFPHYLPPTQTRGRELPRQKFIFHANGLSSHGPLRGGLYRGLSWYYLFTNYSIKDWMAFMDLYGMPLRLGKYKKAADDNERETLKKAVMELGSDAAAVISEDTTIEFIESRVTGGTGLFREAVEFFNRQKSKRVLGQTLTTEQGSTGSHALGKVHERVRYDIVTFDARMLDETISRDLFIPLITANFGPRDAYPRLESRIDAPGARQAGLEELETLHKLGVPVSLKQLYRAAGAAEPGGDEERLETEGSK